MPTATKEGQGLISLKGSHYFSPKDVILSLLNILLFDVCGVERFCLFLTFLSIYIPPSQGNTHPDHPSRISWFDFREEKTDPVPTFEKKIRIRIPPSRIRIRNPAPNFSFHAELGIKDWDAGLALHMNQDRKSCLQNFASRGFLPICFYTDDFLNFTSAGVAVVKGEGVIYLGIIRVFLQSEPGRIPVNVISGSSPQSILTCKFND